MASGVEVGVIYPGSEEVVAYGNGTPIKRWVRRCNSVGGVGVKHKYYNASGKTIKYVTFVYLPYNPVGDVVDCEISGDTLTGCQVTGPIEPFSERVIQWDTIWYNSTITTVRIKEIHVQYMDGTEEFIDGKDVVSMDSHDSVYYEKRGKYKPLPISGIIWGCIMGGIGLFILLLALLALLVLLSGRSNTIGAIVWVIIGAGLTAGGILLLVNGTKKRKEVIMYNKGLAQAKEPEKENRKIQAQCPFCGVTVTAYFSDEKENNQEREIICPNCKYPMKQSLFQIIDTETSTEPSSH